MKEQFWHLHPKLQLVICDIAYWAWMEEVEHTTLTSLLRSEPEQRSLYEQGKAPDVTSVHMFGRGADIRRWKSERLNQEVGRFNEKYVYDPARPHLNTVVVNDNKDHHHIQVCNS